MRANPEASSSQSVCTRAVPCRKTILIAEDNKDLRDLMGIVLRRDGYDVCEAENGKEALDQLDTMSQPPCLMLLDLMMPVMDGQELLKILIASHRLDALPVVVLSAGGNVSEAVGATQFISKPADPKRVLAVVHEICGEP
ncbi:MAG TPA: response regulator [Polyangiales bacterium]|nr:response regulator [Polyangiales bacterium]